MSAVEGRDKVLLIEDSPTYLKVLKTYLERDGFDVVTASSGEEGLRHVEAERPDLILVDYGLPGLDGAEVVKHLKSHTVYRSIPVIMLTMKGESQDITRGLEAGADDYIVKTVDVDILLLRIKNLLRRPATTAADVTPTKATPAIGSRQRILSVDDDKFFLRLLEALLKGEGYDVSTAHSGEEGLAMLAEGNFDCVLVDYIMPGILGDEVCRRVKAQELTRDIPVILLTSRGDKADMIAGFAAGADDYIVKSTDTEVIKSRVRALLRRKYIQDENRRIQEEIKRIELEAAKVKADRDLAQTRAQLADQLRARNEELVEANRKLRDAQAQLVQAEKLAALGQLTAGIAHEINNPLAYVANNLVTIERDVEDVSEILGAFGRVLDFVKTANPALHAQMSQLLEDRQFPVLQQELKRYLEDAREGLERVKHIVVNLRNFSRLDEGEVKVVDITEGLESTLKILGYQLRDRIAVVRDYGTLPRIECFPGMLNQVFMNLLVNACQAITESGTITIKTRPTDAGGIEIAIADSGCGMTREVQAKIFDPFFTTKPVGTGTGLGLPTSYGIIQKHGGDILVTSTPGVGSTFTLVLPPRLPVKREKNA